MKYKLWYSLAALMLLFASCTPIEDRAELGPVLTPGQLKIAVIQKTAGSNAVTIVNSTPGTIMYLDWGTGTGKSASSDDSVSFYQPFAGTFKLMYTAFCAGGEVTDSTTYTIAANDENYFNLKPAWNGLTNNGAGQTWVIALDYPGGIIAGNGDQSCVAPQWWTLNAAGLAGQLSAPWSESDQVYMDLKGAAHFQVTHADGSVTKGFFNVIADYVEAGQPNPFPAISVSGGAHFPWPSGNGIGQYHFTKMTANELSVHDYGQYNVCVYKRLGYTY
jgi:hypothetical protein